jgi:hypothetical protein
MRLGALRIVRHAWSERPVEEVKGLALRLTTQPDVVVLFGVSGARTQLVFARSENVTVDLKPGFDRALAALGGGKGGGGRVLMGSTATRADATAVDAALQGIELPGL